MARRVGLRRALRLCAGVDALLLAVAETGPWNADGLATAIAAEVDRRAWGKSSVCTWLLGLPPEHALIVYLP